MRHTGLRFIGITAVAAAALAFSGGAWAQQKAPSAGKTAVPTAASTKGSSSMAAGGNCIEVRGSKGTCIHSKSGTNVSVKAAAPKAVK